jgi:hypothetical protein
MSKKEISPDQSERDALVAKKDWLFNGLFVTNSTPEGLEKTLIESNGFFSAVSSEQGLFNSLLGNSYGNARQNNNDLVLNGFDGGEVNSLRAGRAGFNGSVIGAVCCFAQQGSVETILNASNGTGVSERFLMLSEPHNLGIRNHKQVFNKDYWAETSYASQCDKFEDVIEDPLPPEDLIILTVSPEGFDLIKDYRNSIEAYLADGGRYSHISLRGAGCKIDMQIMKLSANLHLSDFDQSTVIADKHVISAIRIANELLEANLRLCQAKGIMGLKAEFTAVINYMTAKHGVKSERELINSLRSTQPFKDFSGKKSNLIKDTLAAMTKEGLLVKACIDRVISYQLGQ